MTQNLQPDHRRLSHRSIMALALVCAALAEGNVNGANPRIYPERRINGCQVSLAPLFRWWEEQHGFRPLLSWKHFQGTLEKEIINAWVLRGQVEGKPRAFVLKNPPVERLRRYRELKATLAELEQARASAEQVALLPSYDGYYLSVNGVARTPVADFERIERIKRAVPDIRRRISEVTEELAIYSDKNGDFKTEGFALVIDEMQEGKAVYDFGYFFNPLEPET